MLKVVLSATGIMLLSSPIMAAMTFDIGIILDNLGVKIGKDISIISVTVFMLVTLIKGMIR